MAEPRGSASSSSSDPFSGESPWAGAGPPSSRPKEQLSLVLDVARMWVRKHQKPTMLGAFAAGVVLGSWLRD